MNTTMGILMAGEFAALTTVYWVCLIVGGGMLLISAFAGGHGDAHVGDFHADAGVDVHAGAGLDHSGHGDINHGHGHAGGLTSWFSIRFLVFFLAVFGLIGVTLTHLTATTGGAVLGAAALSGVFVGQGVHQLLRKLNRSSGDSTTHEQDYINKHGRITVRVDAGKQGEVAIHLGQGERFIPAMAKRADTTFRVGDRVVVAAYTAGVAEVVSKEEHEFLTDRGAATGLGQGARS